MFNEDIAILIARNLTGEATVDEQRYLIDYLQTHPNEQYFYDVLYRYWKNKNKSFSALDTGTGFSDENFNYILKQSEKETDVVPLFDKDGYTPEKKKLTPFIKRLTGIAASIILLIGVGYFFSHTKNFSGHFLAKKASVNEVIARLGTKSKIILPDGTTVLLNAGSKLTYNQDFMGAIREVDLEGEAFFNVVKDAAHPFIVHTSGINIKVLGTEFNVKSYAAEPTIEATLIRGLIEVERRNEPQSPKIILKPHEKLVFNKQDNQVVTQTTIDTKNGGIQPETMHIRPQSVIITALPHRPDSALVETDWVYNKLIFDGDSFEELARKIERWFNVHIVFKNDQVAKYKLHGVFENESIEQMLEALQLTVPFKYTRTENDIEIY
jgi:Fe2+-dicitrate sensor, membrane component